MEISDGEATLLAVEIAKLAKEAVNLRKDVRRLAAFFPKLSFDEEVRPGPSITVPVKNASELLKRLRLHRSSLEGSQGDVRLMEAHLRTMRDKVQSRTDWEFFKDGQKG